MKKFIFLVLPGKKIDINQIREVEIEMVMWSYKAGSFSF